MAEEESRRKEETHTGILVEIPIGRGL